MRSLDCGFLRIVNVVLVEDSFYSKLANVREAGCEIFRRDDEAGRVAAIFIWILVVLNEKVDIGDITGSDGGSDVVDFLVGEEGFKEFELSLGLFACFAKLLFVDGDRVFG